MPNLLSVFMIDRMVPALVAALALIVLIMVARIYAASLRDYGFAQGDAGKSRQLSAQAVSLDSLIAKFQLP